MKTGANRREKAKSDHKTLGQCSRRYVGAKHLPTAYPQGGWHYRKCFAPTASESFLFGQQAVDSLLEPGKLLGSLDGA